MSKHKRLMTRDEYRQKEETQPKPQAQQQSEYQQPTVDKTTVHSDNNEPQQQAVPTAHEESELGGFLKLILQGAAWIIGILLVFYLLSVYAPRLLTILIIGYILYFIGEHLFW